MRPGALKLFFDGGCRPNPGRIEIAVVARGTVHFRDDLGSGDNNDAEWLALVEAARLAQRLGAAEPIFIGDAALVVAQATGTVACNAARFEVYRADFRALTAGCARVRVRHVGRHQNLAGIALERRRALPA